MLSQFFWFSLSQFVLFLHVIPDRLMMMMISDLCVEHWLLSNQIKSNHFYCHITTAQVPWWVKFLWACSRQCRKTTDNLPMDRQCKKPINNLHMDRQCKKTALEHLQCSRQCKKKKKEKHNSNLHMDRQCKKTTSIYIWTDSAKKLHWSIYSAPDSAKKKKKSQTRLLQLMPNWMFRNVNWYFLLTDYSKI